MFWVLITEIEGFGYSVQRGWNKDGSLLPFAPVLDRISNRDDTICVFNPVPTSSSPYELRRSLTERTGWVIMSRLIPSNMHDRYKEIVVCMGFEDDPEQEEFKGRDLKVVDKQEMFELIEQAGPDPQRVDVLFDVAYAQSYIWTVNEIERMLCYFIAKTYFVSGQDRPEARFCGNKEAVLLGIAEKPDWSVLEDEKRASDIEHISNRACQAYEHRKRELKARLFELRKAWERNARFLAQRYHEAHPDLNGEIVVDASEIVSIMLLDHAKEAYDTGVPIDDIFC